jgi:hypothetical protein
MSNQTKTVSASDLYSAELLTKAKEFWYAFDNRYNTGDTEVNQLLLNCNLMKENPTQGGQPIPNLDWMFFSLRDRMRTDPLNYEKSFTADMLPYKKGIITLANDQSGIIAKYLDLSEIQQAFEVFGQGVIFDERRGTVHKMDGRFPRDLVGYRRWHGFIRATIVIGEDSDFWLKVDRYLLLAYLLQSKLQPLDTKKDNPFIDKETLAEYQSDCMSLDLKNLDEAFSDYFPQNK